MKFIKRYNLVSDECSISGGENIIERAAKIIAMKFDNAVVETVIEVAKREGITDLFLIDEDFVKRALLREAKHGKWMLDGRCSECLENPLTTHKTYCPNCGARMDGE